MSLSFGWRAKDKRESFWVDDPDLVDVSEAAREAWASDGDAAHLRPFVRPGGKPTRITMRPLTVDESRFVRGIMVDSPGDGPVGGVRAAAWCFRIGVDFPDLPKVMGSSDGAERSRVETNHGIKMLAEWFVQELEASYPAIVDFYGVKVLTATFPTEQEKKASSPPSTQRPSSAAASSTEAVTESPARVVSDVP